MGESVTIVVPTYREAENLPHLLSQISDALNPTSLKWSVIVVDDNSPDETSAVCEALAEVHPLQLIVRTTERGLASAVVAGMKAAESKYVLCMDADLSHPASAIPAMIEKLSHESCDFVIGSRYVKGGSTDDAWGFFRWLNSAVATAFAKPLTCARDPMAGFFALRKADFDKAFEFLDPVGYKIGLELIVKCDCRNVGEVPIHFADRQFGESKLSLKEQLNYLRHVSKLYEYRWPELFRFLKFGAVGGSGVIVNLAILTVLLRFSMMPPVAMAIAIWGAMSTNYLLNRSFTFKNHSRSNRIREYVEFCTASLAGAVVNWSVATALWNFVPPFSRIPELASLVGVFAGMGLNYFFCRQFVFGVPRASRQQIQDEDSEGNFERASAA